MFLAYMERLSSVVPGAPTVVLTSDASGSWGYGAYTSDGWWFQLRLPESWRDMHITVKELLLIVIGAAVWGSRWRCHAGASCSHCQLWKE